MVNLQSNWWRQYRRHRFTTARKLTTEVIFRQAFKDTCMEYIKNCGISGVNHIYNPNNGVAKRSFWLVIFGFSLATLVLCLKSIWSSLSIPLIVTMESTTYPIAEIDFPAVVVCNVNRISKAVIDQIADNVNFANRHNKKFNQTIRSMEELKWNLIQFGRLIDFEYSPELGGQQGVDFGNSDGWDTHAVTDLMMMVAPDCDEMMMRCMWRGKIRPCKELFSLRKTTRGFCCAFNYLLDDGEYGHDPTVEVKRQTVSGRLDGLSVVLDPQVEDYAYPLHHMKGFDVLLFDAKHYPSGGRTTHRFVGVNTVNLLELQSRKQLATREVRKYSPKTRNCLFEDERYDEYGGMYSMSACIARCRIRTLQSLCRCNPFFLPSADGPICTMADLWCLNKYKVKFLYLHPVNPDTEVGLEQELQDSLYCPDCLPDCEHTQHYTKSIIIPINVNTGFTSKSFRMTMAYDLNMTNKCILSIYQSTSDATLDRLDVVLYWFELLSNFGGFAGILLGLSIATVFEWLFFFIIFFTKSVLQKISQN